MLQIPSQPPTEAAVSNGDLQRAQGVSTLDFLQVDLQPQVVRSRLAVAGAQRCMCVYVYILAVIPENQLKLELFGDGAISEAAATVLALP